MAAREAQTCADAATSTAMARPRQEQSGLSKQPRGEEGAVSKGDRGIRRRRRGRGAARGEARLRGWATAPRRNA